MCTTVNTLKTIPFSQIFPKFWRGINQKVCRLCMAMLTRKTAWKNTVSKTWEGKCTHNGKTKSMWYKNLILKNHLAPVFPLYEPMAPEYFFFVWSPGMTSNFSACSLNTIAGAWDLVITTGWFSKYANNIKKTKIAYYI